PAFWRQFLQFMHVAATQNHVIGFDCCDQSFYDIGHVAPPFLFAKSLQSTKTDIVLESGFLVGQVSQCHRFDDAIDDESGSQSCAKTQKEHLATAVTTQRLHCCVVDDSDGTPECR